MTKLKGIAVKYPDLIFPSSMQLMPSRKETSNSLTQTQLFNTSVGLIFKNNTVNANICRVVPVD